MSHVYTPAKTGILNGSIDLTGGDDIRVALVMTDTTADTEEDTDFMDQFTTLDEMDGAGYSRQAFANEAVNEDLTGDRAEFDADDATFTSVGIGTRQVVGALIYKHVNDDTDSIPIAYIDTGGDFDFDANGGNIVLQWNGEGILQLT